MRGNINVPLWGSTPVKEDAKVETANVGIDFIVEGIIEAKKKTETHTRELKMYRR
jgi:hypothetical protein